jgi:short-subunit dehydrogenase
MAVYAASKAFVVSFTQGIAEEIRGSGVRLLGLCPGPVPTGFQQAAGYTLGAGEVKAALTAEQTVDQALRDLAGGRMLSIPGALSKTEAVFARLLPDRLLARSVAGLMVRVGRR